MSRGEELVEDRLTRLELPFDELGYDAYGVSRAALRTGFRLLEPWYRRYFRVRCHHAERVPTRTRAMLVCNHSGGVATDALMMIGACFFDLDPPRLAQGMADKYLARLPFASRLTGRVGQLTGLPSHAVRLLEDDRLLLVFPEGVRGTKKLYPNRRELVRFGTGFVRLAMKTRTPIVPVGVLGGGEAVPTFVNLERIARPLGLPYLPLTPYGLPLPLPARFAIHFGEPLVIDGSGDEEDEAIETHVASVQGSIRELLRHGSLSYKAFG